MSRILFICTGNQCRSPMAAALLRFRLAQAGVTGVEVESAGFLSEGRPVPAEVIEVLSPLGIDVSSHRSRPIRDHLLDRADLILVMTRQHLVDLVVARPGIWSRTFTLAEILRRGEAVGARHQDEDLASWVFRVNAGRERAGILKLPLSDDVPDPIGGPLKEHQRLRDLLVERIGRLTALVVPA
jgi:protein-tyrosine phosphatase